MITKQQIENLGFNYMGHMPKGWLFYKDRPEAIGGNWYGYYMYSVKLWYDNSYKNGEDRDTRLVIEVDFAADKTYEVLYDGECETYEDLIWILKHVRLLDK